MKVKISKAVEAKLLEKHQVTRKEIVECFENRDRRALRDQRENHDSDPPTFWIISETNKLRRLKVIFIVKSGVPEIRSAYEPEPAAEYIYKTKAALLGVE